MKKQRTYHKYLKQVMIAMTLVLALGMFVGLDAKPVFGEPLQINIAATSNNAAYGTVTGGGVYAPDATVTLDAVPKAGCRFVDWLESSSMISSDSTLSFTATADRTLVAVFAPIAKPVISSATSKGYDSAKIVWSKVEGAASYDLYRATSATGTYTKVANTTALSYTQTGLTTGRTYYYTVKAVCQANITVTTSAASAYKAVKPIPSTPVATAASASYTSNKISWAKITGATGYKVYRATSSTGTYSYLASTTGLYYTNSSLTTGKTYYYKVYAYHTEGTTKIYSKASAVVSARPIPATPVVSSVITKTSTSSKIYWGGVSGASRYQIFRSTSATGTYTWVYTTGSTARSYINTGLTLGKTYYYKVRAYHLEGTTKVYSKSSAVKSVTIGSKYYSGLYKVGRDIPAGEYLLMGRNDEGYVYVSLDAAGNDYVSDSDVLPNLYLTLKTGQYVEFDSLTAYPIAKAPMVPKDANGNLINGQYKVGRDITAGEYVLTPDADGYMMIVIESDSTLVKDPVGIDLCQGMAYVSVANGQYLTVVCKAGYAITNPAAPVADTSSGVLNNGMYKVGRDFPAGTYTLESTSEAAQYLVVNSATHPLTDFFLGNSLTGTKQVDLADGQYIFLSDCALHMNVVL